GSLPEFSACHLPDCEKPSPKETESSRLRRCSEVSVAGVDMHNARRELCDAGMEHLNSGSGHEMTVKQLSRNLSCKLEDKALAVLADKGPDDRSNKSTVENNSFRLSAIAHSGDQKTRANIREDPSCLNASANKRSSRKLD